MHHQAMANLSRYRADHGISQRDFAKSVECDQSIISRIERGEVSPSLKLAARIERVTGGVVPALSWVTPSEGDAPSEDAA